MTRRCIAVILCGAKDLYASFRPKTVYNKEPGNTRFALSTGRFSHALIWRSAMTVRRTQTMQSRHITI